MWEAFGITLPIWAWAAVAIAAGLAVVAVAWFAGREHDEDQDDRYPYLEMDETGTADRADLPGLPWRAAEDASPVGGSDPVGSDTDSETWREDWTDAELASLHADAPADPFGAILARWAPMIGRGLCTEQDVRRWYLPHEAYLADREDEAWEYHEDVRAWFAEGRAAMGLAA